MTEAEIEAYRTRKGIPRMSEWTQQANTWQRTWAVEAQAPAALVIADAHGAVWGLYGPHETKVRPTIVASSAEEAKTAADRGLQILGWGPYDADLAIAAQRRANQGRTT